jgi:tetrapyrrole methylase family protein/MazG family protein
MVVYLIEEIYELADAIETGNVDEICEELGDVLFHVFFLAGMFQEAGSFSIEDVACSITRKMTRRHPHVFGTEVVNSAADVAQNWQKIKLSEKNKVKKESILDTIPANLPALMRAYMISDRTSKAGFEHNTILGHLNDTVKHLAGSKSTLPDSEKEPVDRQLGDLLFEIVNLARGAGLHPETALSGSVKRFEERFKRMEKRIRESGEKIQDISQDEKDRIWARTQS